VRFSLSAAVTALVAAVLLAPAAPALAKGPISIQQCFVTVPKPASKLASGTQIVYVNRGTKIATHITFTVAYRNSDSHYLRTVTDTGQFSPGSTINHHFDLFNDVTYGGKSVQTCNATKVVWMDGTIWKP
jgi:hypothetical protein